MQPASGKASRPFPMGRITQQLQEFDDGQIEPKGERVQALDKEGIKVASITVLDRVEGKDFANVNV